MADAIQVASLFGVLSLKDEMTGALDSAKSGLTGFVDNIKRAGAQLSDLGGAMTVIGAPIAGAFGFAINQAVEMENALAQTEAVLKSTGGVSGQTTESLIAFADSMEQVTGFADDAILTGENLLLTFTNIGGETFPRATTAMLNMSVAMKQDLKSSAIQLGKALNDPVKGLTALTRVGVTFTTEQENMIKAMVEAGDVAGAQAVILAELEREFGGSAIAAGQTFGGQIEIAKRQIEDMAGDIGDLLIPMLSDLLKEVKPVIDSIVAWIQQNPELVKGIALAAGALTVLGPILMVVGGAIGAIGTILGVILSPIGLIVAAIVGLYLAFQNNFLGIRDFLMPIIAEIQRLFGALQAGVDPVAAIATTLGNLFGTGVEEAFLNIVGIIRDQVIPALDTIWTWFTQTALPEIRRVAEEVWNNVLTPLFNFLGDVWNRVSDGLGKLFNWFVADGLPGIRKIVEDVWNNVITPFINTLKGIWESLQTPLNNFKTGIEGIFNYIGENVIKPVVDFIQDIIDKVNEALRVLGLLPQGSGQTSIGVTNAGSSVITGGSPFSNASGLSYVPYDNYLTRLHEGERVMTAQENLNGGGSGFTINGNITVIANDPQDFMNKLKAAQVRYG